MPSEKSRKKKGADNFEPPDASVVPCLNIAIYTRILSDIYTHSNGV